MSAPPRSSLEFLSPARQALLVALKHRGEATTDQLSGDTFLSPGAVRQHLLGLEALGIVGHFRLRDGPGRPRHVFRLTGRGEELFPQQYALMANEILSAVAEEDEALLARILSRLVDSQVKLASAKVQSQGRPQRLLELVQYLEEFGYYPKLEMVDNEAAVITLRHCPIFDIANEHPGVCEVECRAIRSVLGTEAVTRVAHRLAGDNVCGYSVD